MESQVNKGRLLKLAKHLKSGELGHKKFDFGVINHSPFNKSGCGTRGCALGELPFAFPKFWKFDEPSSPNSLASLPIRKGDEIYYGFEFKEQILKFFDIKREELIFLFYPHGVLGFEIYTNRLNDKTTKKQVAAHIKKFVKNGGIYNDQQ